MHQVEWLFWTEIAALDTFLGNKRKDLPFNIHYILNIKIHNAESLDMRHWTG